MKLNRKWINEDFVDLSNVSDKEFVETLTVFGQKVETWERMDADIKNVVVGKVLSMVRHPNSDHMFICQVDVGQEEPVQIVTGAQNVHEGDLVPAALHNSWLPGGVHITKGKLRGEVSNGMLCSFAELGLTQNDLPGVFADGIWILEPDAFCRMPISAPIRSPMVMSSATTRPSIWWNMGEWVASASSLRNTRPGASMQMGGLWVSM